MFRAAIIKSGSAMVSWAYTDQSHLDFSTYSMGFLRTYFPNQTDAQLLHERTTLELELAFTFAQAHRPKDTPTTSQAPTVALEKRPDGGEEPKLIRKDAEAYILQPARTRVPILMGMTSCEYDAYGVMYTSTWANRGCCGAFSGRSFCNETLPPLQCWGRCHPSTVPHWNPSCRAVSFPPTSRRRPSAST